MINGIGAGKGDVPRPVVGEAFRKAYDSIKKPESLNDLLVEFDKAVNNGDYNLIDSLHYRILNHPYYRAKQ